MQHAELNMNRSTVETAYTDHFHPGQIDHYKWMIITTNFFS